MDIHKYTCAPLKDNMIRVAVKYSKPKVKGCKIPAYRNQIVFDIPLTVDMMILIRRLSKVFSYMK